MGSTQWKKALIAQLLPKKPPSRKSHQFEVTSVPQVLMSRQINDLSPRCSPQDLPQVHTLPAWQPGEFSLPYWYKMVLHGIQWYPIVFVGYRWICRDLFVFDEIKWYKMVLNGIQCCLMVSNGIHRGHWVYLGLLGSTWVYLCLPGSTWVYLGLLRSTLVLHGSSLLYMNDIEFLK